MTELGPDEEEWTLRQRLIVSLAKELRCWMVFDVWEEGEEAEGIIYGPFEVHAMCCEAGNPANRTFYFVPEAQTEDGECWFSRDVVWFNYEEAEAAVERNKAERRKAK